LSDPFSNICLEQYFFSTQGPDALPGFSTNTSGEFSTMVAPSIQREYVVVPSVQGGYVAPPSVQGGYIIDPSIHSGYMVPPLSIHGGYMIPPSVQGGYTSLLAGIHEDASAARQLHFDEVSNPATFE